MRTGAIVCFVLAALTTVVAVATFFETIVAILKVILIPRIVRVLMGDEDEGGWGIFPIAAFLFACGAIVYGEYYLIPKYLFPGA